jgi:hypothetical protein
MRSYGLIALVCCALSAPASADERVATRMRNVTFHVGDGVELQVFDLAGHLLSTSTGPPVFDNVTSYVLAIDAARVAMSPESLTNLLNNHVFAAEGSPISNVKIGIEGNELTQSGTLKKGIHVPFSMHATIAATPDGRIRLHPTSLKAAGFVSKRVLDFFGLDLEDLVKTKHLTGVAIDGDDLLLEPAQLIPPPRIRGHLTRAWIENGLLMQQFGGTIPRTAIAPSGRRSNYMYYRHGTLRFGKLTMRDADLLLVDADPKDAFDFSPKDYNAQLIAGYSKNTAAQGLIVYMPDLSDLRRRPPTQVQAKPPQAPETRTASKGRP